MTSSKWDTVVVPYPFIERAGSKRRPALVLSRQGFNDEGHTLLAMITTSRQHEWPGDTDIADLESAGLGIECFVRLKVFTVDNRLILRRLGVLAPPDRRNVDHALTEMLR